jgi:hypothetical protein
MKRMPDKVVAHIMVVFVVAGVVMGLHFQINVRLIIHNVVRNLFFLHDICCRRVLKTVILLAKSLDFKIIVGI